MNTRLEVKPEIIIATCLENITDQVRTPWRDQNHLPDPWIDYRIYQTNQDVIGTKLTLRKYSPLVLLTGYSYPSEHGDNFNFLGDFALLTLPNEREQSEKYFVPQTDDMISIAAEGLYLYVNKMRMTDAKNIQNMVSANVHSHSSESYSEIILNISSLLYKTFGITGYAIERASTANRLQAARKKANKQD